MIELSAETMNISPETAAYLAGTPSLHVYDNNGSIHTTISDLPFLDFKSIDEFDECMSSIYLKETAKGLRKTTAGLKGRYLVGTLNVGNENLVVLCDITPTYRGGKKPSVVINASYLLCRPFRKSDEAKLFQCLVGEFWIPTANGQYKRGDIPIHGLDGELHTIAETSQGKNRHCVLTGYLGCGESCGFEIVSALDPESADASRIVPAKNGCKGVFTFLKSAPRILPADVEKQWDDYFRCQKAEAYAARINSGYVRLSDLSNDDAKVNRSLLGKEAEKCLGR